jgi:hypothetical protein
VPCGGAVSRRFTRRPPNRARARAVGRRSRIRFTPEADPRLVELVSAGHPVLLVARWSDRLGGFSYQPTDRRVREDARRRGQELLHPQRRG